MGLDICACPNCDCPETLMPRFGGAASVCGLCRNNQCKEVADAAIEETLAEICGIVVTLTATGKDFINSDDVAKVLKAKRHFVRIADAYGSCHDRSNGVIMLNTYGDEIRYPDNVAYCACLLSPCWEWHLVDIAPDGNIVRRVIFSVPEEIRSPIAYGKRAFYWDRQTNKLSLRCKPEVYAKLAETHRDSFSENDVSGPRMVLRG